ncbi:hypothetical protein BEI60_06295 [Eisenbergiella tayi]|nr:hypothetical protein BEI60_06295 [Eisenbergiella tayi]
MALPALHGGRKKTVKNKGYRQGERPLFQCPFLFQLEGNKRAVNLDANISSECMFFLGSV